MEAKINLPSLFIIISFPLLVALLVTNLVVSSEIIFTRTYTLSQGGQPSADALNVFGYVAKNQELNKQNFSNQAISHLSDVKTLFINLKRSLLISFFIFTSSVLLHALSKQAFLIPKFVRAASKVMLATMAVFIFTSILFFEKLFYVIHLIVFRNKLWLFPENDHLIKLFPESLFFLYALIIYFVTFTIAMIVFFAGNKNG